MLLPYKGKPLIRHTVDASLSSNVDGVVVVINQDIKGLLREATVPGVNKIFLNDRASEGLSSSVKAGLMVLPTEVEAAVFLLGDQPLISKDEINRLVEVYRGGCIKPIYQSAYRGKKGHPVLFQRKMFNDLLDIEGDSGGRSVIQKYQSSVMQIEMGKEYPFDIDTVKDYERLLRKEVS
jgi:molybdenum cofactor cytidylyltransferase